MKRRVRWIKRRNDVAVKLVVQLMIQDGNIMGHMLPVADREEKIHYQPHCTERIGNLIEKIQIKETGLVPKGRHFGLQFFVMGGAYSDGYERQGLCLSTDRTSRSSQTNRRNDTIGQYGTNETTAQKKAINLSVPKQIPQQSIG
jgi:hypothetical protein